MTYKDHFWIGNFLIYDVTKTTWGVSWFHMTTCIIVPFLLVNIMVYEISEKNI